MSNIIKDKDSLALFDEIIKYINNKEITKSLLEEILLQLLPRKNDELLIKYEINDTGFYVAYFDPNTKSINPSIKMLKEWLDKNMIYLITNYNISNHNSLRDSLLLWILTHEIEHSYQYLMGEKVIEAPNEVLKEAYKGLYDLLKPRGPISIGEARKIISYQLYIMNQDFYILERNADIESTDLISRGYFYNGNEEIGKLFENIRRKFMKYGYFKSTRGSIEETYLKILMYDKYKKFYHDIDMSEDEKIRYGFRIREESRQKLLK